ncbi:MAG: hypothetical protein ACI3T9_04365 [Romboutsia timonensis]
MKLNTNNMKKMLSHMSKCKPNNLLEITNYYELALNEDGITVTGTDGNNFISIFSEEGAIEGEYKIIVKADQFTKLVNKVTSEYIDLQPKDEYLQIKANGTYKCEMYAEEDYPDYEIDVVETHKINTTQLVHGISAGKNAKSNTAADGVLFSYLIRDDKMVAADSIKVSYTPVNGFGFEVLIPPSLADMLSAIDSDMVKVSISEDKQSILFEGNNVTIYGALAEGSDEYPDVTEMFEDEYPYNGTLDTTATLQALDRLKLFMGAYDGGLIDLSFTDGALILSTLSGSNEVLPFSKKVEGIEDVIEYRMNGAYLNDLVKSMIGMSFDIHFGEDDSIKLVSENDQFILATADEEE